MSAQRDDEGLPKAIAKFRNRLTATPTSANGKWLLQYRSSNATAATAILDDILNRVRRNEQARVHLQGHQTTITIEDEQVPFTVGLANLEKARRDVDAQNRRLRIIIDLT